MHPVIDLKGGQRHKAKVVQRTQDTRTKVNAPDYHQIDVTIHRSIIERDRMPLE